MSTTIITPTNTPISTPVKSNLLDRKRKLIKKSIGKRKKFKSNKVRKYMKKQLKIRKSARVINVAEDKEFSSRSYYKQKVTQQQQNKINKRFSNGYSVFEKNQQVMLQLPDDSSINKCKWIWRTFNTLDQIYDAFNNFPEPDKAPGTGQGTGNYYRNAEDQSIYFNEFKNILEIMNPTNYDQTLVIYDIVFKDNCFRDCSNDYLISGGGIRTSPLELMQEGLNFTPYMGDVQFADTTNTSLTDINMKPTQSYPFNLYCNIIKKHIYRLQPGATMTHTFTHQPKCLMNRGFLRKFDLSQVADPPTASTPYAIKDLTSGCLLKVWGQLANSGTSTTTEVLNRSGALVVKYINKAKWYAMTQRFNYIFNSETAWDGKISGDSVINNLEVINDTSVKKGKQMDLDDTNNEEPTPT